MWADGIEDIKYDSNVSLLYGFEIPYYDVDSEDESSDDSNEEAQPTAYATGPLKERPEFVWDKRHGRLHASTVDFVGSSTGQCAVVVGILLGGPRSLHYSTSVTTTMPTIEHHVLLAKFRKLNAHVLPEHPMPKLIAFAQTGR